ncbi:MAG: divergent polysaccharide deacetylase family protein [Candidatus Omnitrophica bacterium]|nr:divergent polysaccharide deacetylase family protein [Candidatus Omnitrophota bacterium]
MKRAVIILIFFIIGVASGVWYAKSQGKAASDHINHKAEIYPDFTPARVPEESPHTNPAKAYVSIVLDDWGYNTSALDELTGLMHPVTVAILPELPYSRTVANAAIQAGHEVILHMPMEPVSRQNMESLTLLTEMDGPTLRANLQTALSSVPHVRGVSNHTGSAFTANAEGMSIVLNEIAASGLYFFDSMVTAETVGYQIATDINLPTAKRDIFIDNVRETEAITGQLEKLADLAVRSGSAIGIGHDEEITLRAIQDIIPEWEKQGIEMIALGDLIQMRRKKSKVNRQFESLVNQI